MTDFRSDFPIYKKHPNLVYLDSTATTLKPYVVVESLKRYYTDYSANVFRGIYKISEKATLEYESAREKVAGFISAKRSEEIIFTRNTTESLNLIAYALGRKVVSAGDEVVVSILEHHSNFVPWQMLSFEAGADFKVVETDKTGKLPENWSEIITNKTKIVALTLVSNVIGVLNSVQNIIKQIRAINPKTIVVVDAAQAMLSSLIDVGKLDCDFLAFSGHKTFGPTGIGVLYGRYDLLKEAYPFMFGGEMIRSVEIEKSQFQDPPFKFEAGTPAIAEAIALGSAIDYINSISVAKISDYVSELSKYCFSCLKQEFGDDIEVLGPQSADERKGIFSFKFYEFHPHDVAGILDSFNIAVRAGHHCAMPLHKYLGYTATVRASFQIYNNKHDVDRLIFGLKEVKKKLL
ncbi:MAG: cysteine desulfurase [Patescibacteria group bacterium]|nr:MAG: cysteine desulfurase [Patescibacteria group bacterium]